MQGEKKEYKNAWLTDSLYIKNSGFQDTYYLESLCYHINSFVKNTPVPVVTELDKNKWGVWFSVGHIRRLFKVNVNYAYFDYITLVKSWLIRYYPQYNVNYEIEVPLDDGEILAKVKNEGLDLNDAIHLKKKSIVSEHAVIEKLMMKEDQFLINKNGKRFLYMSGTIKNPQSVSSFKRHLLTIEDDMQKKNFIDENSTLIREFDDVKEVVVDYQGQQMLNFFRINFKELSTLDSTQVSPFQWKFGRFNVKFSSQNLMADCLKYFNDRKIKRDGSQ